MTLPINRTALIAAQANQVPSLIIQSALNIAAIQVPYDGVDELNAKVDALTAEPVLPHADGSVTNSKIAPLAITNDKVALATLTADRFVAGALQNETQNGLEITAIKAQKAKEDNIKLKLVTFGNRLSTGVDSTCILLQGDSTGNETTEWFYKSVQWLAAKYATHTFIQRLWSDTDQNYGRTQTVIQTGSSGDAYATLPGLAGSYINAPDNASISIVGDIDVRAKIAMTDWTVGGGTSQMIIGKFGEAGARGWAFAVDGGSGKLFFWWSANGTTLLGGIDPSGTSTVAPTVVDGATLWVRVTLDVDNGAAGHTLKFYTGTDGVVWTQLGSDVTTAGTTSIFDNTAALEIGSRSSGSVSFWAGKVFYAEVRNGIDGKIVASPDLDQAFPTEVTTFNDAEGNIWTTHGTVVVGNGSPGVLLLNASQSGQVLSYSANVTRFALQTPMEPVISFISYGHNETTKTQYTAEYQAFINQLLAKYPDTLIGCVAQNPQKASTNPFVYPANQAIRCEQICALAIAQGYGLIDAYHAFINTGISDSLINSDGVHPLTSGSNLWKNVATTFMKPITVD